MSATKAILASSSARRSLLDVEAMLCCLERVTRRVMIRWKLHETGRLSPGASDSGWGNAVKRGPGEGCLWKLRDATERQDKLCGVTILVRVHCSCVAQPGLVHWAVKELTCILGLGKGPLCFVTAIATALLHLKYPKQQQLTKCWWLCFPIPREPATDVIVCARKIRAVSRSLDYQFPGSAIESACGLHVPRTMTFSTHFSRVPEGSKSSTCQEELTKAFQYCRPFSVPRRQPAQSPSVARPTVMPSHVLSVTRPLFRTRTSTS